MKKAYIRRTAEGAPNAGETTAAQQDPVPPTAAEFLGWPNTNNPWLRLAFIHDALVRNASLPEEKRWRITAIDLAAALGVEQKSIHRDITFLREKLGAPITTNAALHCYEYSEDVPPAFVDMVELLRVRKAAARGQRPAAATTGVGDEARYGWRKIKQTSFERMERIHKLLLAGKPMTGPQLARAIESSVCMINRDIAFMRLQIGLPIAYRPELAAYAYTGSAPSVLFAAPPSLASDAV